MSLTLTVVGFLLATALVILLARTSTARWERASRAPVAAHPDGVGARMTRAGLSSPPAVVRRVVAAIRGSVSLPGPVRVAARTVGTMADRVPLVRSLPPLMGRLRASLAGELQRRARRAQERPRTEPRPDGAPVGPSPTVRNRHRGTRAVRRRTVPGAGGRLFGRNARRRHGRLHDLLHRHRRTEDA